MIKTINSYIKPMESKARPFLDSNTHKPIDDKRYISLACKCIEEYETRENKPVPMLDGAFKQWLKEANTAIKNGESVENYKQRTLIQKIRFNIPTSKGK